MSNYGKTIVFFNSTTATTNTTISEPSQTNTALGQCKSEYAAMDVLVCVSTMVAPANPSLTFSIQETFSDSGYVTTATTGSITAAGNYFISHLPANSAQLSGAWGNMFALGQGYNKQITTNWNGTATSINASIYFVFNNKNFA